MSFLDDLFVAHRLSGVAVNIFTVTGRNMINTSPAICVINTGAKQESKKDFFKNLIYYSNKYTFMLKLQCDTSIVV